MPGKNRYEQVTAAAVPLVCLLLAVPVAGCTGAPAGGQFPAVSRLAASFLGAYVRPDGRVTRQDQGGDTVSEGQAYGLLLAEAAGRPAVFGRIWRWTRAHLQLPSGLFAYHANAAGQQLSDQAATDADLLTAWALLRYQGPETAARHRDGRAVAAAVLAHEAITGPGGTPVLAAGPWATGPPASLNPSYWSLPALTGLARLTGDPRWRRLAAGAVTLAEQLTKGGRALPPDWAKLTATGVLAPEPLGSQPQTQYGPDAQRMVAWFAASCNPRARALAARWWALLHPASRARAQSLRPDGAVLDPAPGPLPLVAAAAAAQAAGRQGTSQRLLGQAVARQHRRPTYYGGAWAALGPALLSGPLTPAC